MYFFWGGCVKNSISTLLLISLCLSCLPGWADDLINVSCEGLQQWASAGINVDDSANGQARGVGLHRAVESTFAGPETERLFGKPFANWSDKDIHNAIGQIDRCLSWFRRSDPQTADKLLAAVNFLLATLKHRSETAFIQSEEAVVVRIHRPNCQNLAAWAAEGAESSESLEQRQKVMFSDSKTEALFGLGFSRWNIYEMYKMMSYVADCRNQLYPRDSTASREGDQKVVTGMQLAQRYVGNIMKNRRVLISQETAEKLDKLN
jgi:hypothetical protein